MNLRQITIKDQIELKKVYFDSIQSLDDNIYSQEQKRAWSSQAWNNSNFDKSIIEGKGWLLSKNIVAIGGGGFGRSLGSLEIEKYIVSLSSKKRPKICFIPTASGDSSLYKLNFYRAFSKLDCITSHIDFFLSLIHI